MSALGCLGCKAQCVTAAGASRASGKHRASAICRANTESSATCSKRQLLGTALFIPSALWGSQLVAAPLAQAEVDSSTVEAAGPAAITALVEGSSASTATASGARQVFLDVKVEGQALGRIVVELSDTAPVAAQRFADLAEGKQGVGYRLSKFDGIFNSYIRNEGVKSLSYNADGTSLIAGGDSVQALEDELASTNIRHDTAGLVSIVVKEAVERPVKERLVAMNGKLVTLKEQAGEAPNGTSFMITTGPTPELDKTNLVVGKVVQGFDVVEAVAALPFAKPRDSYYDKPFFEAGKMMGDKRATVAEKRFNRPLKRVLVANAGVL